MNSEQMNAIVGLIAGVEAAVLHLANVMAEHKPDAKEALANSFEQTAQGMPNPLMALPLQHIAKGLRNSTTPQAADQARELLDRLQRGSTPPPAAGG